MAQGIVVASDRNTAWLLPWWWKYYSLHNSYPVTFVDLGLSQEVSRWCQERGSVVCLDFKKKIVTPKSKIPPQLVKEWEWLYGKNVWKSRNAWFFKPYAMLAAPYAKTIWTDVDCEICGSLKPLFEHLGSDFAIVPDPTIRGNYNSGVIVFRKDSSLLKEWAKRCLSENHRLIGDEQVLSELLASNKYAFNQLPQIYNQLAGEGMNPAALIIHWAAWGKIFIETHGGAQAFKASLLGS